MKRMTGTLVGVIWLGLGLAGATPAAYAHGGNTSLIHGCVNKNNGTLRIIAATGTCTSKETLLDWNIAGPAGPAGATGATGPAGPPSPPVLAVYDVNNTFVGDVVGMSGTSTDGAQRPYVAMKVGDVAFVLEVFRLRFFGNQRSVMFSAAGCSGSPYLSDNEEPLPYVVVVGNIAYVADSGAAVTNTFLASTRNDDGSCIASPLGSMAVLPALQVDLSVYSPPFIVK